MKMKSIAARPFKYAGKMVQPQAEFSVTSPRDAKIMALLKRATAVQEEKPPVVERQVAALLVPTKRAYKRRDMVAEVTETMQSEQTAKQVKPASEEAAVQIPPEDSDA